MSEEQVNETTVKKEAKEEKPAKETKKANDEQGKKWNSDIKKIGDKIVSLTLMQAKELGDYLKEEYGIVPAAGGAVIMSGPAVQGQAVQEEVKSTFNLILKSFGDKKIQVIKEVRALTGLGLKEAKDLVDGVPKPLKEGMSKEDAQVAQKKLEAVGAVVELV
jgi:large subunit ribosomal protein L7/L12